MKMSFMKHHWIQLNQLDLGYDTYSDGFTDTINPISDAGTRNLYSSGVGAGVNFVARVASGQDVDDAAKSAADAGLVTYATTALLAATPLAPFQL